MSAVAAAEDIITGSLSARRRRATCVNRFTAEGKCVNRFTAEGKRVNMFTAAARGCEVHALRSIPRNILQSNQIIQSIQKIHNTKIKHIAVCASMTSMRLIN